jgi:hypothetical protein
MEITNRCDFESFFIIFNNSNLDKCDTLVRGLISQAISEYKDKFGENEYIKVIESNFKKIAFLELD